MDDDGVVHPSNLLEGAGHEGDQMLPKHPDDRPLRTGGIGHGSQDIEARADAQPLPDRCDEAHGGMVDGRKHEGDAALLHASHDVGGLQIGPDAQGLEDVGTAARARNAAVAGLGHRAAACCRQHDAGGGYVDGVGPVPAGAHDVQRPDAVGQPDGVARGVHGPDHAGDFCGSFAPRAEEGEEAAHLDLIGAGQDGGEGVVGFDRGQAAFAGDEGFDVGFEGGWRGHGCFWFVLGLLLGCS
mmetsp:Transcript_5710/g.16064  ORF Transcript_5710/g.16064 Transcript_5710/m.16064 type:complete len:241 (-) Transcript_5710:176-898(-)